MLSTGSCEQTDDGKYRYAIVDANKGLEYSIKTETKVEVKFGTPLAFKNVVGGETKNGGWYSADTVEEIKKNA